MMAGPFGDEDREALAAQFRDDIEGVDDDDTEPDENGPPPEPPFEGPDWPGEGEALRNLDGGEASDVGETVLTEEERQALEGSQRAAAEEGEAEEIDEAEPLYAGKFTDVEGLENAYLEVTSGFTRIAQDRKAMQDQMAALQARDAEREQQMQQLVGYLTNQMAESDPEFAEQLQRQQQVEQLVQQRVQPILQQQEQQMAQQTQAQRDAAAQLEAQAFYAAHPDVVPQSEADQMVARTFVALANAGVPLVYDRASLDVAFEASQNPQLALDLMMNPRALEVPGGLDSLRARSGATIAPNAPAPGENGTRRRGPVRQRVDTFVEVNSGGAPAPAAPGAEKLDEFQEAWDVFTKEQSSKGPLFGSARG